MKTAKLYYGFDMGGTKIEMGVFDRDLNRLWAKRVATPKHDYAALVNSFRRLTEEADAHFATRGVVGIGIPGLIDHTKSTVFTTNVPAAQNKPFVTDLESALGRPIKIDNDANCFVLSESMDAEFKPYQSVLGVIIGTGLGGGVVVNGHICSGRNNMAGEIGHVRLNTDLLDILGYDIPQPKCGCGQKGCVENYLSGRGFEWLYQYFYGVRYSAPEIITLYRQGEPQAKAHVERYISLFSTFLASVLTLFDPHLVVIGGGLSNFGELYEKIENKLPVYLFPTAVLPRIVPAKYGDAGGVRGAAFLNLVDEKIESQD